MVDRGEARRVVHARGRERHKLDIPNLAQRARPIDEIHKAAAHAPHGRDFQFAGADLLPERGVAQLLGTIERRRRISDLEPKRADRRSMGDVMRMREAFLFLVDNQVDPALRPACDCFRFMASNGAEAERGCSRPV